MLACTKETVTTLHLSNSPSIVYKVKVGKGKIILTRGKEAYRFKHIMEVVDQLGHMHPELDYSVIASKVYKVVKQ